jgi:hypothetical protein
MSACANVGCARREPAPDAFECQRENGVCMANLWTKKFLKSVYPQMTQMSQKIQVFNILNRFRFESVFHLTSSV